MKFKVRGGFSVTAGGVVYYADPGGPDVLIDLTRDQMLSNIARLEPADDEAAAAIASVAGQIVAPSAPAT